MQFTKKVCNASFRASIPVLLGYVAMGIAAGVVLSKQAGAGITWAFLTSSTSISGALQFMAADMFANRTSLITVAFLTFSINIRYALYGLPLIERWRGMFLPLKAYMIWTLTDETFALVSENKYPDGEDSTTYCFLIALFDHLYWIAGVMLGCAFGSIIPFNTQGIEFAMTALFIVVLLDQLQLKQNRKPALIGCCCAALGLFLYPSNMLIPTLLLSLIALLLFRRKLEVHND